MCLSESSNSSFKILNTVDRIARATDLWVRHGIGAGRFSLSDSMPCARQELAAGIIYGLCDSLELDDGHLFFTLYVYSLLNGDTGQAMTDARELYNLREKDVTPDVFRQGLNEADNLMALLQPAIN
jgi:hypothetical protein